MTITLLDGGMGQELVARSRAEPTGLWATQVMMQSPELVADIHRDYFAAGADIATTNTYAIHRDRLQPHGIEDQFKAMHQQACKIACRARDLHGQGKVAGAIGPTSASYRPDLAASVELGTKLYSEIAKLHAPYVDLILLETMSSIQQAHGAVLGASQANKPVWLGLTVDDTDGSKLRSGEDISLIGELYPKLPHSNLEAILINCSVPEAVSTAIKELRKIENLVNRVAIGGYANGFTKITEAFKQPGATVTALEKRKDLDEAAYLEFAQQWQANGATIIGGCCEVGPSHIQHLAQHLK